MATLPDFAAYISRSASEPEKKATAVFRTLRVGIIMFKDIWSKGWNVSADSSSVTPLHISELVTRKALKNISWPSLQAHLESATMSQQDTEKLLDLVRTQESLIFKHPTPEKQKQRDQLLLQLHEWLKSRGFAVANGIKRYVDELKIIEDGFAGILALVAEGEWNKSMTPSQRVSASIGLVSQEYTHLLVQIEQKIRLDGVIPHSVTITAPDGREIDSEVIASSLLAMLKDTVMMEAHQHDWFDLEGTVQLPDYQEARLDDLNAIYDHQVLASSWRNWDGAQHRVRFRHAEIQIVANSELANLRVPGLKSAVRVVVNKEVERLDFIANERLTDWFKSETRNSTSASATIGDKTSGFIPLSQYEFLCEPELLAYHSLEHTLSIDVGNSTQRFGDLLLTEWIRGYAALNYKAMAGEKRGRPSKLLIRFKREQLLAELERVGMSHDAARAFVRNASLNRSSRDLYDQPLISLASGDVLLIVPAVSATFISQTTLSAISSRSQLQDKTYAQIELKGEGFEAKMTQRLRLCGLAPKHIHVKQDSEEFEYDIVFVWGDYVFLFECKNRSLSFNNKIAAYYFEQENHSHVKQVKRLADALIRYPDILATHMPEAVGKKLVSCVVNALPYAIPGGIDGILFADASAILRFLSGEPPGLRQSDNPDADGNRAEHPTICVPQWSGKLPTPLDFIASLTWPLQVALVESHVAVSEAGAWLGVDRMAWCGYFQRMQTSEESMRKAIDDYIAFRRSKISGLA